MYRFIQVLDHERTGTNKTEESTDTDHLLAKRRREEMLDLLLVDRLATGRDGARRLAARVQRVLALVVLRLVRGSEDTRADVGPCAVVEWLLLAPEDVRVRVLVEVRGELEGCLSARLPLQCMAEGLTRS